MAHFSIKLTVYLIILISSSQIISARAGSFYHQQNQYRGFYWFESPAKTKPSTARTAAQLPAPLAAAEAVTEFKQQLEEARDQMLAVAFNPATSLLLKRQAVINYRRLEARMWQGAESLVEASEMANFTEPTLSDNHAQPTNVFGIKLQRQIAEQQKAITILEFAQDFDLLLFVSDTCPYCQEFMPVLQHFISQYHYQLEITSLTGKAGQVAEKLGITKVPTLIAIKKDGRLLFEVSRGMISAAELENNILLAKKYVAELDVSKSSKIGQKHYANATWRLTK